MAINLTKSQRLMVIIGISSTFFLAEIAAGFYTKSLALVADAFHYLNDIVGFIVALAAFRVSEGGESPKNLSFGWQRATLLGAFFNGVFLLALAVSIFLQSVERFVSLQRVENPRLVLIVGCIGLFLNIISAAFLHEHDEATKQVINPSNEAAGNPSRTHDSHADHRHGNETSPASKGHDFGLMGVLIHVLGDAANNVGVIIAAAVIWKANYPGRFYADPAVSMAIAIMIFISSIPLVKKSGLVLLESAPIGVDPSDVQHDIEQVPGVIAVHELHVWRLNQQKSLASAHVVVSEDTVTGFARVAATITECLHAYGIHSATIQPELPLRNITITPAGAAAASTGRHEASEDGARARSVTSVNGEVCTVGCKAAGCVDLTCCE